MEFGLDTAALRKRQEAKLEVAEIIVLSFFLAVTRVDRIRNEDIRGWCMVDVWEVILEREYLGKMMLRLEVAGRHT